jgi:hypothetical protein
MVENAIERIHCVRSLPFSMKSMEEIRSLETHIMSTIMPYKSRLTERLAAAKNHLSEIENDANGMVVAINGSVGDIGDISCNPIFSTRSAPAYYCYDGSWSPLTEVDSLASEQLSFKPASLQLSSTSDDSNDEISTRSSAEFIPRKNTIASPKTICTAFSGADLSSQGSVLSNELYTTCSDDSSKVTKKRMLPKFPDIKVEKCDLTQPVCPSQMTAVPSYNSDDYYLKHGLNAQGDNSSSGLLKKRKFSDDEFTPYPVDYGFDPAQLIDSFSGGDAQDDMNLSSRRRRKLGQIVPYPRKPREAEYSCSLCGEAYSCVVVDNPWWASYQHECPSCKVMQVPRLDINSAANAIELDPNVVALYGEGLEDSDCDECEDDQDDESGEEDERDRNEDGQCGEGYQCDSDDCGDVYPFDGEGLLSKEQASLLLVLFNHARTCTGIHSNAKQTEVCRSVQFLMLHIRDCNGTDIHGRECQFSWCLPCKKMLRHLTHCNEPHVCSVCNPWNLPTSFQQLRSLNLLRCKPCTVNPPEMKEVETNAYPQLTIHNGSSPVKADEGCVPHSTGIFDDHDTTTPAWTINNQTEQWENSLADFEDCRDESFDRNAFSLSNPSSPFFPSHPCRNSMDLRMIPKLVI